MTGRRLRLLPLFLALYLLPAGCGDTNGAASSGDASYALYEDGSGDGSDPQARAEAAREDLAGRFAAAMEDMEGVSSAEVAFNLDGDGGITHAWASLELEMGEDLSDEQKEAVQLLISNAIEGLAPEDVSLILYYPKS